MQGDGARTFPSFPILYGEQKWSRKENQELSHSPRFTLIELLVVIAVIAMLLSILMPALKSQRSGQTYHLQHPQKDIGTALSVYSMNNRDAIPSSTRSLNEINEGKDAREAWRRLAPYYDKLRDPAPAIWKSLPVLNCCGVRRRKNGENT